MLPRLTPKQLEHEFRKKVAELRPNTLNPALAAAADIHAPAI